MDGLEVWGQHKLAARSHPGGIDGFLDSVRPTGPVLERGLQSGELVEDVRVRDAIEAIRAGCPVDARLPTLAEDVDFARDVASTLELDVAFGARARTEALQRVLERR
jgi:hypothetical protein